MESTPPSLISIPADALVLLIGAAGSGKSTFAKRHFAPETIVSSDAIRVAKRAGGFNKTRNDVFDDLSAIVEARLAEEGVLVVDATNADWMRRSELIRMARNRNRPAVGIVFAMPQEICLAQNRSRANPIPASIVRRQVGTIERDLERFDLEGLGPVYVLRSPTEADGAQVAMKRGPVARASP